MIIYSPDWQKSNTDNDKRRRVYCWHNHPVSWQFRSRHKPHRNVCFCALGLTSQNFPFSTFFPTARNWKQPTCPPMADWINCGALVQHTATQQGQWATWSQRHQTGVSLKTWKRNHRSVGDLGSRSWVGERYTLHCVHPLVLNTTSMKLSNFFSASWFYSRPTQSESLEDAWEFGFFKLPGIFRQLKLRTPGGRRGKSADCAVRNPSPPCPSPEGGRLPWEP